MHLQSNRAGTLRENVTDQRVYESFVPAKLPPTPALELDANDVRLLRDIYITLGRLQEALDNMPSRQAFLGLSAVSEAVFSSRIEGIDVCIDDLLKPWPSPYDRKLTVESLARMTERAHRVVSPAKKGRLNRELLCAAHRELLGEERFRDMTAGFPRVTQVWIAREGGEPQTALFVPPNPEDMQTALGELEAFMKAETPEIDPVVKAALIHYQFETIHPFADGNGRLGRLLFLFSLLEAGVLTWPHLETAYFLKLNQRDYYDRLTAVRERGSYEEWIRFVLLITKTAAEESLASVHRWARLRRESEEKIKAIEKGARTLERQLRFLDFLENNPIVDIKRISFVLGLTYPTASKMAQTFADLGILTETTGRKRDRLYEYKAALAIFRKESASV